MFGNPLILDLVQEILESNRTPEEVCAEYPELLWEVRKQLKRTQVVEAHLAELFPSSIDGPTTDCQPQSFHGADLPEIPGYRIEEVIGHGGMGVVFRARHLKLNRLVALKMLLSGAFASRPERERFLREAEAVAALSHSHIVQVHDVGESERRPYFTMECLEGGSLAQRLGGVPQSAHKSAELVATLARAIAYAHDHGIVHRDLKPGNILLAKDDTPKIADFGLARRVDSTQDLTLSGARLGTPSYMAPEQASGKTSAVGPGTDIYALGAILYEMLTGRPPFRAATAAETERQVIAEEPVRPSRLNASIPRDLETICLKCLHKDPQRRYAIASDLAADLQRCLDGKPVLARPVSLVERIWKWARRRPSSAALIAISLALFVLAVGAGFWFERIWAAQREERARQEGRASQAVEDALEKATALEEQGHWPAARQVLIGAESHLDESNNASLEQRFRLALADAGTVTTLEDIRLRAAAAKRSREALSPTADQLYSDAFRQFGIGIAGAPPHAAAERIRDSSIRETLISFLHDWLHDASEANRPQIQAVADRADTNEWRRAVRLALLAKDSERLKALASAPEAELQPTVVFSGLARALHENAPGDEVQSLLRKVQLRHSEDFWINYFVGDFLLQDHPEDAIGYLSAAVGIRPNSSEAYMMLGRALRDTGDAFGAITAFRMAASLDPAQAGSKEVARALVNTADLQDAREIWEKALATNPPGHDRWNGYAALCLFLGNEEAYARGRRALLQRSISDSDHWAIAERNSLSCLLRPAEGDELPSVLALVARAVEMGPKYPHPGNAYIQFVSGLSHYRLGHYQEAIPLLQEAAAILPNRPGPRLVLAMAQFQSGKSSQALHSLAVAVRSYNWKERQANSITTWVNHVLRREAEALILPQWSTFLKGAYQPRNNDERLALVGVAQSRGQFDVAVQLYADAFADDPKLPEALTLEWRLRGAGIQGANEQFESLNTECRYLAARCAALAASDTGNDGSALDGAQCARWRQQSHDWLMADLAAWQKILDNGSVNDCDLTKRMLTNWEVDPDLAGLRDKQALNRLPAEERERYHELWQQVRALRDRASRQRAGAVSRAESRTALIDQRRLAEAQVRWQMDLEADPPEHDAWSGYADLCLFLGQDDDFRRARQALVVRFGAATDPFVAERTGKACLLVPSDGDTLAAAVALVDRASANPPNEEWVHPHFEFTRGLCAYRQGKFDEAISRMRSVASRVYGPAPGLVVAMSLEKSGRHSEATESLATAILECDWREKYTRDAGSWTFNVLRREAERMILPDPAALVEGTYRPQDNSERLALLGMCQFEGRWNAAARLFAEAFAADPSLPERLVAAGFGRFPWQQGTMDPFEVLCSSSRFGAARCAALAACGSGGDHEMTGDEERITRRKQVIQWLASDLEVWKNLLASGASNEREVAKRMLSHWQSEPDLAALREPDAIGRLPAEDAAELRELWSKVSATLHDAQPTQ